MFAMAGPKAVLQPELLMHNHSNADLQLIVHVGCTGEHQAHIELLLCLELDLALHLSMVVQVITSHWQQLQLLRKRLQGAYSTDECCCSAHWTSLPLLVTLMPDRQRRKMETAMSVNTALSQHY